MDASPSFHGQISGAHTAHKLRKVHRTAAQAPPQKTRVYVEQLQLVPLFPLGLHTLRTRGYRASRRKSQNHGRRREGERARSATCK